MVHQSKGEEEEDCESRTLHYYSDDLSRLTSEYTITTTRVDPIKLPFSNVESV